MPRAFEVPISKVRVLWALRVLSKRTYDSQAVRHHLLSYLTPFKTNQLDEAIDFACAKPGARKVYVTRNVTMPPMVIPNTLGCLRGDLVAGERCKKSIRTPWHLCTQAPVHVGA